jgi:hypothetical protein
MTNCDWWSIKWNIKCGIEDFHSSLPYDPLIFIQQGLLGIVMNSFKTCSAPVTKMHNSRSNKHN